MQIFFIRIQLYMLYLFIYIYTSFNDTQSFNLIPYSQENHHHLGFPNCLGFRLGTAREISTELAVAGSFLLWPHPTIVGSQLQTLQLFQNKQCGSWSVGKKKGSFSSSHLPSRCVILPYLRPASPIFLPYFARYPWNGRRMFGQGHRSVVLDR